MTRRMRCPPQFAAQSGALAASFKRATCLPRAGPAMLLADGAGGPPSPPGSDTAKDEAADPERSGTRLGGRAPRSPNLPIEPAAVDVPPAPRAPRSPVPPLLAVLLAGALLLLRGGGSYYVEYSSFESITSRPASALRRARAVPQPAEQQSFRRLRRCFPSISAVHRQTKASILTLQRIN